jgi:hypothetical protein
MDKQEKILKLTLMLMYLTSWEENEFGSSSHRAWKGYDFDVLNKLEEEGMIWQSRGAKSVRLTEKGLAAARETEARLEM